ncbi:hypothetical protein FKW77_004188 [Venturia effusa]|uniref:Tethering factor for nuclear proteasome STS1 n=1 Tax=Venturia effusa TaxID=50376 RepID=A0A517LLA1_9PEZI|nr:hypothetical protein FKW77_004188 [Venturia effusa]
MNGVLQPQPAFAPHQLSNNRLSPSRSTIMNTCSRKRKPEDDGRDDLDTRMSASPSPKVHNQSLPQITPTSRRLKRARTNTNGRALPLNRLLETLSEDDMRQMLRQICERRPDIGAEVATAAPRPSVQASLDILSKYEATLRGAFPYGGSQTSEYSYNRVRQPLMEILDALKDYTPNFLPPNEVQTTISLNFLDGATNVIHRLPNWESYQHNRHKSEAYEEMAKAWALVIQESAKRGGGIQLQYGGWDQKLNKHNEMAGGKMEEAVQELRSSVVWMGANSNNANQVQPNDPTSIRQQLLSGTYGYSLRVGQW